MYKVIEESIIKNLDKYFDIVRYLYDNPEIGNQEFKAQKYLTDYLLRAGFEVNKYVAVETDFVARYASEKPGAKIAFLCEYDALPEVGHGCAHNLIAAIAVAAGEGLKSVIDEAGGEVYVMGTPAEENFGGKVHMANAGLFDDMDVALMFHPSTRNSLGSASSALYPLKFEFFGKNAHACRAYHGSSALDAAVLAYQGINMLRQFTKPEQSPFIHGVIKDGGQAANVIPAYASMEYYFRAKSLKYAKEMSEKAVEVVKGACLATDTKFEMSVYECPYEDTVLNYTLGEILKSKMLEEGIDNIEEISTDTAGSSDVGAVSYRCPTIQGYIKIAEPGVAGHSKEFALATLSEEGKKALKTAAASLAKTALELIKDKALLEKVKKEQELALSKLK